MSGGGAMCEADLKESSLRVSFSRIKKKWEGTTALLPPWKSFGYNGQRRSHSAQCQRRVYSVVEVKTLGSSGS